MNIDCFNAGCSVYEDRPTAWRYYPIELLSTRRQDELLTDDMALLRFGDRMIRQIMYGEETIALKGDALEQHLVRRGDRESVSHVDAERPSMAAYEMPLDGEDGEKSK